MPRRSLLWGSLVAVSLVVLAVGLEGFGLAWFATQEGGLFYRAERSPPPPEPRDLRHSVFRPYLGFGVRSGVPILRFLGSLKGAAPYLVGGSPAEGGGAPAWTRLQSNNFGFYADLDYPVREPGSFIVGIFGGSVAHSLAMQGGERLAGKLAALPDVGGRRVRVLNFASGGYKQPQQVIALAYFLLLGQHFDYVVNLDGFNEVALGALNERSGVDSSMPSVAHMAGLEMMASSETTSLRRRLEVEELRARRESLQRERARARFAAHYLIADLRLRRATARWTELASEPLPRAPGRGMLGLLPPLPSDAQAADPQATDKIVGEWLRGSRLLAELAGPAGAGYVHVLQPNQYASGHTFSPAEAKLALDADSPYAPYARSAYPALRRRGAELAAEGIAFVDASGLFDDVTQIVYADDCCHYNQRGNDLLADLIFRALRAQIEAAAAKPD